MPIANIQQWCTLEFTLLSINCSEIIFRGLSQYILWYGRARSQGCDAEYEDLVHI